MTTGSVILDSVQASGLASGVSAAAMISYTVVSMATERFGTSKIGSLVRFTASVTPPALMIGKYIFSATANAHPIATVIGFAYGAAIGLAIYGVAAFAFSGRSISIMPRN